MKKLLSLFTAIFLLCVVIAGCDGGGNTTQDGNDTGTSQEGTDTAIPTPFYASKNTPTININKIVSNQVIWGETIISGTINANGKDVDNVIISIGEYKYYAIVNDSYTNWKFILNYFTIDYGSYSVKATINFSDGTSSSTEKNIFFIPADESPAISNKTLLNEVPSYINDPRVIIDQTGKIHVMYLSKEWGSNYNIAYRNSDDWSTRTDITQNTSMDISHYSFTIDQNNKLHLAYSSNEYNDQTNVVYRNSDNWEDAVFITTNSTTGIKRAATTQKILIDSSGRAIIVYRIGCFNSTEAPYNYAMICSKRSDDWSVETDLLGGTSHNKKFFGSLDAEIDTSDNIHIIYSFVNSGYYNIGYHNTSEPTKTSLIEYEHDGFGPESKIPQIIIDSDDVLHISYVRKISDNTYNIIYANSKNWGEKISVGGDLYFSTGYSFQTKLDVDELNRVHLIYYSSSSSIVYQNSSDWSTKKSLYYDDILTKDACIEVDKSGKIYLIYTDYNKNNEPGNLNLINMPNI
jgi:hypothetical protein